MDAKQVLKRATLAVSLSATALAFAVPAVGTGPDGTQPGLGGTPPLPQKKGLVAPQDAAGPVAGVASVPKPASLALLSLGILGLAYRRGIQ